MEALARMAHAAASEFCDEKVGARGKAEKIKNIEREADKIVRIVRDKLDRHQEPPIRGRRDIFYFVHNIDNVIDRINDAIQGIAMFNLPFASEFLLMGKLLCGATNEMQHALPFLRTIKKIGRSATGITEAHTQIKEIEKQGDRLRNQILTAFEVEKKQAAQSVDLMRFHTLDRMETVIEFLERALDQCEDVGNLLESLKKENV